MLEEIFPQYDRKYKKYLEDILRGRFKPMEKSIKESIIRQFERV